MTYYMDDEEEPEEMVMVEIPKRYLTERIPQEAKEAIKKIEWECRRDISLKDEECKNIIEKMQKDHAEHIKWLLIREKYHLKEIEWYRENAPVKYHLL